VDAEAMEGWWYEGAGIYRHTWLVKRDPVHIITDGVHANPVRAADGTWSIPAEVTLENSGARASTAEVEMILTAPDGREVVRRRGSVTLAALTQGAVSLTLPVEKPDLWSVDKPTLYTVRTDVYRDGVISDTVTTKCGFRTIRFDADEGFFLNDQPLKLKGVCNHQDHAGVGVALPDSLWEFRIRRLKEMGVNAYRCAHNPPAREFLEACDRMGMLVMDENRHFNPTPEYIRQLEWLVRRDRNHPSVILWSVFNEEPMQGTEAGYEMVRRMAAIVKRLDPTRPVTAAMNGGFFTPLNVSHAVDVAGFNYQIRNYDRFRQENPRLPLTSSEDTSGFMTRGEFVYDPATNRMSSYDDRRANWGATHRDAWKAIDQRKWLAGAFVWTGFDYRGEPTPWQWPSVSSFFGAMDLCGFPKTAYYIRQAHWIKDRPILHVVPHWNWPDRVGQPVKVMVISNVENVTVSLNGQSLGEKRVDPYDMATFEVPYAPGKLEAVAMKDGREVARFAVETTGAPVALRLTPDRPALAGDGWDALPITVEALDAQGRPVPTANSPVTFALSGPGEIIGHGNGDPNSHEPEKGENRRLFNGLAQVIVRSQRAGSGPLVLRATSEGLAPAEVSLAVQAVPAIPAVPPMTIVPFPVAAWRLSPASTTAPDPNQVVAENDQNSWVTFRPGQLQKLAGGNWAVLRGQFTPPGRVRADGGRIRFAGIAGRAEIWLDGKLAGTKEDFADKPFEIALPAGEGARTLSLRLETQPDQPAGLSGIVTIELLR
jgi:beta-galactosidase